MQILLRSPSMLDYFTTGDPVSHEHQRYKRDPPFFHLPRDSNSLFVRPFVYWDPSLLNPAVFKRNHLRITWNPLEMIRGWVVLTPLWWCKQFGWNSRRKEEIVRVRIDCAQDIILYVISRAVMYYGLLCEYCQLHESSPIEGAGAIMPPLGTFKKKGRK